MKRVATVVTLVLLAPLSLAESQRYVIALQRGVGAERGAAIIREAGEAVRLFRTLDAVAADLSADEVAVLRATPGVRFIEPVVERRALGSTPVVPGAVVRLHPQSVPAGIDLVGARELWRLTRGEGVNVVVVDTGFDYTHPELAHAWAGGYNAISHSDGTMDYANHGTHVAGTIAAADNEVGVVGVAPRVRLWSVKALRSNGIGTSEYLISALDWIVARKQELGGNWIVNLSLGWLEPSAAEREAISRALAEDILVIAATGNSSTPEAAAPVAYPAAYPGVIAVGAVDAQLRHATFSNQGPEIGLVAPGVDVLSTVRLGGRFVSGVLAGPASYGGVPLEGSPGGFADGEYVFCGLGRPEEFPADVNGRIAVIRRGEITFARKVMNARAAGATAVVVINHDTSELRFTLLDANDPAADGYEWPITFAIARDDGERLLGDAPPTIAIAHMHDDYAEATGTSTAAPHVTGVAALLWSMAPSATASQIRTALLMSATDLGTPGLDILYGSGIVNAVESAKLLNVAAFEPSGRRILRRGR